MEKNILYEINIVFDWHIIIHKCVAFQKKKKKKLLK